MTPFLTKTFTAEIVREHSSSPVVQDLGEYESTMSLYFRPDGGGFIEWDIPALEDGAEIGLWFEYSDNGTRTLVDYDGIFSLPREAVALLRAAGVIVPEDME